MAEYIDKEELIEDFSLCGANKELVEAIIYRINLHPTADVLEVVRCKDCGAYLEYSHCEYMGLNGFCSLGFRTPKERGGEK